MKFAGTQAVDIEGYLVRICYKGDHTPTLGTLQGIHKQHTQTIAFENLNSFLKQPVPLDLKLLQQKLSREERGGYCFEQNLLLRSVLVGLGFSMGFGGLTLTAWLPDRSR